MRHATALLAQADRANKDFVRRCVIPNRRPPKNDARPSRLRNAGAPLAGAANRALKIAESIEMVRHHAILRAFVVGAAKQDAALRLVRIALPPAGAVVVHHGLFQTIRAIRVDRDHARVLSGAAVVLVRLGDLAAGNGAADQVLERVARESPATD